MIRTFSLAMLLGAVASPAAAAPVSFVFSQGGFPSGGMISGSFTGNDADADGVLRHTPISEITAFAFAFSGDSAAPDFTLGLGDLGTLRYDLARRQLSITAQRGPTIDLSLLFERTTVRNGGGSQISSSPVVIEQVPAPAALALFGLGVAALGLRRR